MWEIYFQRRKITCISLKLRKEAIIERKKQVLKEFVERNDEIPKPLLESISSEFIGQGGIIENSIFKDQLIYSDIYKSNKFYSVERM